MTGIRDVQKAARRNEILLAAAKSFRENGYKGTPIAGIAERMGAPKSAVGYHQFASKREIAVEIVEQARARWRHLIDEVTASHLTGLEKLLSLLLIAAVDARHDEISAAAIRLAADQRNAGFGLPAAGFSWRGVAHDLVWDSLERGELAKGKTVEEVVSVILPSSYGMFVSENQGFEMIQTEQHLKDAWRTILPVLGTADSEAMLANVRVIEVQVR